MNLWRKLAIFAGGYLVAVAIATLVTTFVYIAPSALPDEGRFGSIYRWWADILPFVMLGSAHTFGFALPGFIAAIALGEKLRWVRWGVYSLAGALDAVLAHIFYAQVVGNNLADVWPLLVASIIGGFVGGAAYWWAAGRFIARRRKPKITSPAQSES
jgi:hypothetical protein